MTPEEAAGQLKVDPAKGLSTAEAQQRLTQYGPNELAAGKKESGLQAFLRQYKDLMQVILLVAAAVSLIVTREWGTTIVLVLLTVFNAVLGLRGEAKAEASIAELTKMMKNIARVRRDGQAVEIEAEGLAPGDIVLVEAGNRVPADGRLFVAATLEIEEAALTGESVASPKDAETIEKQEVPLGDQHNMAFMNTSVSAGAASSSSRPPAWRPRWATSPTSSTRPRPTRRRSRSSSTGSPLSSLASPASRSS